MRPPSRNAALWHSRERDVRLVRAKVVAVDPTAFTMTLRMDSGETIESVPCLRNAATATGGGSYMMHEPGTVVWAAYTSRAIIPVVLGTADVHGQVEDLDDEAADPTNYRMDRAVVAPGDYVVASAEAGHVILRRDGTLEAGASEVCRTVYSPDQNTVATLAQTWSVEGGMGRLWWGTRESDQSWGADLTPTEFGLEVKEFSEGQPIVSLRLGRILNEDGERIAIGGADGEIVYSLDINSRYQEWVDKRGNAQTVAYGAVTHVYNNSFLQRVDGAATLSVGGLARLNVASLATAVAGAHLHTVGGRQTVSVAGDHVHSVQGTEKRTVQGSLEERSGARSEEVRGDRTSTVLNNESRTVAGMSVDAVGGSSSSSYGGSRRELVANVEQDAVAYSMQIATGSAEIQTLLGDVTLQAGAASAPSAWITVFVSGRVQVAVGSTTIDVRGSQIDLSAGTAQLRVDAATGQVAAGGAGVFGRVVTTATHPVDLVTGVPILGSTALAASGASLPGPAVSPV